MITPEGVKPFPATGYRTMDARTNFFYGVTGITPGMAMRLTGIGSQYLLAMTDADKNYFDGAKTYKVTLPKGIPEENFWSFTLYDNMTRSMLDTPQRYPRAGSQSYPSPAAEAERRRLHDDLLRPDPAGGREARQLDPDRSQERAGSRSCASTARSSRSSPRSGGRARSNWSDEAKRSTTALSGHIARLGQRKTWPIRILASTSVIDLKQTSDLEMTLIGSLIPRISTARSSALPSCGDGSGNNTRSCRPCSALT